MTHVSKKKLKKKDLDLLATQFNRIVSKLGEKSSVQFFDEFLSEAERIMFIKRLGAIVMFKKGCSVYRVSKVLLISPSTAERMKLKYTIGAYRDIDHVLSTTSDYNRFWDVIEKILGAGLPPRGKNRWKRLMKKLEQ